MAEQQDDSPRREPDVAVEQEGEAVTLRAGEGSAKLTADEAMRVASYLVEAAARAGGQDPEENDWVRIPMQYIRAAAERLEGAELAEGEADPELAGAKTAEVHAWIRDQTARNAMHVAAGWIAEHGWLIAEVIEQVAVTRDDFAETEYLQYYEQALTDSEVFLYEIEDESDETGGSADAS
jgi:hypothetical protein